MTKDERQSRGMVDGQKIRQARLARKAATGGRQGSQAWLALKIGAHVTSVSDWENGKNQPSARHLRSIAETLGVTVESLYADSDDEDESAPMTRERDMLKVLYTQLGAALGEKVA